MTAEQRLVEAFHAVMGADFLLVHGITARAEERYAVYTADRSGFAFCDDAPEEEAVRFLLFVAAPAEENLSAERKALRKAIFDAGFTYPEEEDDSDAKTQLWSYSFAEREVL